MPEGYNVQVDPDGEPTTSFYFGTENAGKLISVGEDGFSTNVTLGNDFKIEDGIVSIVDGEYYESMPFEYNENAGVINDFLLLQPAPFDGVITKIHFRQGTPDTAIPEITVFEWDGETLNKSAFIVVERFKVYPISGVAEAAIPIKKGQYIGVTEGTGTVCRWYSGATGAGFVYTPEADSGIKRYDEKYITLSYEMRGNELDENEAIQDERLTALETAQETLINELTYDSEKWGEATLAKTSDNLITSNNVTWQYGYLGVSTGTPANTTDQNWANTVDYIPVKTGDVLRIVGSIIGHTSVAMFAFYDSDKTYLPAYTQALVKGGFSYTVPEATRIAFVRFCVGNRTSADVEPTFDTQEIYITTQVPIETPKENLDHVYETLTKLEEKTSLNGTALPLAGKIVFLAGDSRSSTDYTFYKTLLESKCGCTALVQGASGRNVAYNASNAYFERLTKNPHDFSIWIVGGNDTGASGSIGTFSAESANGINGEAVVEETDITADYSGTKFIQAIDHMMRKYKAMFYNFKELGNRHMPKMIFCTDLPQQRSNAASAWSLKENWERKRNAIIECCEKNNVACLDLYKLCNFDMSFEPYWVSPTDKVNDNGLYFMDGLHPNQYGIDIITSLEIEEMKKYVMVTDYIKPRTIVTDGLIMYCDGVDNTGEGHDDTATTWVDLSGNGNNLINVASADATSASETVLGEWTASGMHVVTADNQFLRTVNTFDLGTDRTLELRLTMNADANMTLGLKGADRVKLRSGGANFWVRVSASDSNGTEDISSLSQTKYNTPIAVSITRYYDEAAENTVFTAYVNGVKIKSKTLSGDHRTGESTYLLFGMENDDITIHSVRVYDRALTADEINNNYMFDETKYYGLA